MKQHPLSTSLFAKVLLSNLYTGLLALSHITKSLNIPPSTSSPFSSFSLKLGLNNFCPIIVNNSKIPTPVKAEVVLNNAPISFAYSFPSFSLTSSFSYKSLLLAAIAKTKINKN